MHALLKLSRGVDALSSFVGKYVIWLIFGSAIISALNAVVRKAFNTSSNAFLEIQWYLFAASFLIAAGYTLLNGEHVKIDVLYGHLSKKAQMRIDIFGFVCFLIPLCVAVLYLGTPYVTKAFATGEMSNNAGGLIRWPVFAMLPLGFSLLLLQGISELIKRIAFLQGLIEDPTVKKVEKTAEEELAEVIRQRAEAEEAAKGKSA